MNDQEQPQIQQSNDTDQFVLAKLRQELDIELEKPDSELNVNKINQLTKAIEQVTGTEKITAEKTQQGLQKLKQEIRHQKQRRVFRRTGLVAACACALIIISNIWSYSAHGINSFSAAYQLLNGGIKIDFQRDDSAPYSGNPYYDEMRTICLNNNIEALIPSYIPENYHPTEIYGKYKDLETSKMLYFNFAQQKSKLNLSIIQFVSEEDVVPISIPSSEYNISQQKIGDTMIHISKETNDRQYWAAFQIELTQYVLYADEVDYDECQRVLESMFGTDS